jgi:hypothetical protein
MDIWKKDLKKDPTSRLLSSNPWTEYRTYIDLLGYRRTDPAVLKIKNKLLSHKQIILLAEETKDWLSVAATRNSDPKISYFKLKMLGEFGVQQTDLGLSETIDKASSHIIDNMYGVRGQTPQRPKKGEKYQKPDLSADVWHISPCNSPVITSALIELGVDNEQLNESVKELKTRWVSEKGWFCHFFFVESQFKKLQIGCPIAGLQVLDVFSKCSDLKESEHAKFAFEPIKFHKEYGKTLYYFGRSKKFWTFKYPFVWYNALYLADVLTRFEFTKEEPVVTELIEWILKSQDNEGQFKPTSMYMNYKSWDFSNKKEVSPWITFICCRILKQYFG